MYGVQYFADTWSDNVSFLSATKDTRIPDQEGQLYLRVVTRIPGDSYVQLTRAKQPRVIIEGKVARLQPSGRCYIRLNGVCCLKGP